MRRREFIRLLGSVAVVRPLAAHAQQPNQMKRIGVLMPYAENDPETSSRVTALAGRKAETSGSSIVGLRRILRRYLSSHERSWICDPT